MLFNSAQFLLFLPLVVLAYYILPHKFRKFLLLAASYYFYMQWKAPYIILIIFSTIIDFFVGIEMTKERVNKKLLLAISLFTNLGLLITFKYFNFFIDQINLVTNNQIAYLELILPMGISFYTFQTMSYSIDIYNNKIKPEKDIFTFALYVTFFPQLVAGPIERAGHLLKEVKKKVKFSYSNLSHGLKQMIWGFFKKVAIADNLSLFVDPVFENYTAHSNGELVIAVLFFSIQIYCDFSGYSDIAIGAAKTMGIQLNKNFNLPYFSKSLSEFWRRWHISLSTWFRDYLYIPLGGNRVSKGKILLNIMIVFVVSGFWHGANWTFIIWGAIHGLVLILENLLKKFPDPIKSSNKALSILGYTFKRFYTLIIVLTAWIFFRAENVGDAIGIIGKIYTNISITTASEIKAMILENKNLATNLLIATLLFLLEGNMFFRKSQIKVNISAPYRRWIGYSLIVIITLLFGSFDRSEFIYFQF